MSKARYTVFNIPNALSPSSRKPSAENPTTAKPTPAEPPSANPMQINTNQVITQEPKDLVSIDEKLKLLVAEKEQSTEKGFLPIYTQTGSYAHEHGELDQYRQSKSENMACKEAIEKAISDNFDGMHLNPDAVKPVIESFGEERVAFVLASTIQVKDWDGRFSQSNKDWAASVPTLAEVNPDNDIRTEWAVQSHPAVLDGFVSMVRSELENSREVKEVAQPERIDAQTAKFSDRKESLLQTLRDNQSKIKAQEAEKPEKKAPAKSKGKDMEL